MARQKTRKTAAKRVNASNPKGNRKPKLMFSKSGQHHLKTKQSRRAKRRKPGNAPASKANAKNLKRIIINFR
ncbi:MAG TPA: hypothetical protein VHA74_02920 [Candidatus Dojkabacteria bacterium]|nr:hypothetical protein [Candidatus Dojkabacteria bacterium]